MDNRTLENGERLRRVNDFHTLHASHFPPGSRAQQWFTVIAASVETFASQSATQVASRNTAREGTASKGTIFDDLRRKMEMINRTAHGMAVDDPGIIERFRMPAGSGEQAWLSAARAFVTNATPLEAEFIANRMPADFLAALTADIAEFEQAISVKHQSREAHVTAKVAGEEAVDEGLKALRRLDPIIRNQFHDDQVMLAAWESASHPTHHARKPRPAPTPEPPK
jgi:hypothetical protein